MTQLFTTRPLQIEAVQFTDKNKDQVYNWAKSIQFNVYHGWTEDKKPVMYIPSLVGELICNIGDYLVYLFPTNELYDAFHKLQPVKKLKFEQHYQLVSKYDVPKKPDDDKIPAEKLETGIGLIAKERQRQIDVEGWTPEHDAGHTDESLSYVAACYAIPHNGRNIFAGNGGLSNVQRVLWPDTWDKKYWKPTPDDRIKELAKAGALIAAEIDRLKAISND